jgi:hypothetical protein
LPELSLIEGNQQILIKSDQSDFPSLFFFCSILRMIRHHSHDTYMTLTCKHASRETIVASGRPDFTAFLNPESPAICAHQNFSERKQNGKRQIGLRDYVT